MTDKPILFSATMVQALLDGRKTQTRRIIKAPPAHDAIAVFGSDFLTLPGNVDLLPIHALRGDCLWVRESFAVSGIGWGKKPKDARGGKVHYRADPAHGWQDYWGSWRPSIHMPRWASRLTLIVTDVRVQRLQEISNEGAIAEGIERASRGLENGWKDYSGDSQLVGPRSSFCTLWNSINGPDAWEANPWVAAYSFRVIRANIDSEEVGHAL